MNVSGRRRRRCRRVIKALSAGDHHRLITGPSHQTGQQGKRFFFFLLLPRCQYSPAAGRQVTIFACRYAITLSRHIAITLPHCRHISSDSAATLPPAITLIIVWAEATLQYNDASWSRHRAAVATGYCRYATPLLCPLLSALLAAVISLRYPIRFSMLADTLYRHERCHCQYCQLTFFRCFHTAISWAGFAADIFLFASFRHLIAVLFIVILRQSYFSYMLLLPILLICWLLSLAIELPCFERYMSIIDAAYSELLLLLLLASARRVELPLLPWYDSLWILAIYDARHDITAVCHAILRLAAAAAAFDTLQPAELLMLLRRFWWLRLMLPLLLLLLLRRW